MRAGPSGLGGNGEAALAEAVAADLPDADLPAEAGEPVQALLDLGLEDPVAAPSAAGEVTADPPTLDWWRAMEALRGAYADKTIAENQADFAVFEAWADGKARVALPADPETVAAFVTFGFTRWARRTVERRLAAVRKAHRLFHLADPTRSHEAQLALRRGRRSAGRRLSRQAKGLTASLRDELVANCPADTLTGLRDRALIQVGYDTLCRRAELINLRIEDLSPAASGTGRVRVRRSKVDQEGAGDVAYISARGWAALQVWLAAARLSGGPIFRPVYGERVARRAMHPRIVNRVLQRAAARAGLPAELIGGLSGHSMRVGAAQDLAAAGKSVLQIMRAGRWTSAQVVSAYVREADVNVWS